MAISLGKFRLGIKRVDVRWSAIEKDVNDSFRTRAEMWCFRCERIQRRRSRARQTAPRRPGTEIAQPDRGQPHAGTLQKLSSCWKREWIRVDIHGKLVCDVNSATRSPMSCVSGAGSDDEAARRLYRNSLSVAVWQKASSRGPGCPWRTAYRRTCGLRP